MAKINLLIQQNKIKKQANAQIPIEDFIFHSAWIFSRVIFAPRRANNIRDNSYCLPHERKEKSETRAITPSLNTQILHSAMLWNEGCLVRSLITAHIANVMHLVHQAERQSH